MARSALTEGALETEVGEFPDSDGINIGIRGVWWTEREVAANSMPPHPARIVGFEAPLAFAHALDTPLERAALAPDGVARTCRERAFAGSTTLAVHPWTGLVPAGGDVLQLEADHSHERELVVTCGATAGFTPQIDLRHVFFRQVRLLGSTMGSKGDLFEVLRHVEAGRLRPVVDRVMPLWEARAAHVLLEERKAFGKVVLSVD